MGERPACRAHGRPLGRVPPGGLQHHLVALPHRRAALDDPLPQMHQHLGDVDGDRAHLVAGAAQTRRVRQRGVDLARRAPQLGAEDRADRARVDRAVGVPAGPLVDGADVQAGRAADAAQGLAPHLVGEGVGAAVVEQDQVEGPGPVLVRRAGPHARVRVHALGGGGARQGLQEDLKVPPGGHDLLDADDRDQRLGEGQTHPAVALGLDDHQGAGLGDHEVGAGDADPGPQELLAQVQPGRLGELGGRVGQVLGSRAAPRAHLGAEDVPDLPPVAVDGRHQDVRGPVPAQLHDQFGEIGLVGVDALCEKGLVEPDLLRGHRLDLDDLRLAGRLHQVRDDPVRLLGVGGPVDRAARRGDRLLQLLQIPVEMAQGVVLDPAARLAQRRPVVQLGHRAGPFGTNGVRGVPQVAPQGGVVDRCARRLGKGRHADERSAHAAGSSSVLARISAMCTGRMSVRSRLIVPPMCIRQELSAAHST